MGVILQKHLPQMPWMSPVTARLPGIQPVKDGDWLRLDEAFTEQMAERDRLIREHRDAVHALLPEAEPAALELLRMIVEQELPRLGGYQISNGEVVRPDGQRVLLDEAEPLVTLGRLVQEDFVIHLKSGEEHRFMGAILCFPASWTLAQKIGKPLTGVHAVVEEYDAGIAARVQRLFDGVRVGQPMWRANALLYEDPSLHQPRLEGEVRPKPQSRNYLRSERQCLMRLPVSGAVVFSIHTTIVHVDDVPLEALEAFRSLHP